MKILNRSVVIVKPRQPYVDWANSLDDSSFTLEELRTDNTAFLVPEIEIDSDNERVLKQYCPVMFQHELSAWCPDKETWPKNRNLSMFKEWFGVSFHSMALDLLPISIELEDFKGEPHE